MDRAVTGRIDRVTRYLAKIPHEVVDISMDETAKAIFKRKSSAQQQLPLVTVDGERVGSIEEMDDAVEFGELHQFLRLDIKSAVSPALPALPFEPLFDSPSPALPSLPTFTPQSSTPPNPSSPRDSFRNSIQGDSSFNTPSSTTGPHQVSIADFMSLNLTEEELAELEAEIAAGETFDSASPFEVPTTPFEIPSTPSRIDERELVMLEEAPKEELEKRGLLEEDELDGIEISEEEATKLLLEMDGLAEQKLVVGDGMAEVSLESPVSPLEGHSVVDESENGDFRAVAEDLVEILRPAPLSPDDLDDDELVTEPVASVEEPEEEEVVEVEEVEVMEEVTEEEIVSEATEEEIEVEQESEVVESVESEAEESKSTLPESQPQSIHPIPTVHITPAIPDFLSATSLSSVGSVSDDEDSNYDDFAETEISPFDLAPEAPFVEPTLLEIEEEETVEEVEEVEEGEEGISLEELETPIAVEMVEKEEVIPVEEKNAEKEEQKEAEKEVVEVKGLTKSQKKRASQKAKKAAEEQKVEITNGGEENLHDVSF